MKQLRSKLYTTGKIQHLPLRYVTDPDSFLFAEARYKTRILESDLPEWYISCYIYHSTGFLSAKGVKHLANKPNYAFTNHLYKDDLLFISFEKPLIPIKTQNGSPWYDGYDHILSGSSIYSYVEAVEKYSSLDVSNILNELHKKREWYILNNPPEERYEL